RVQQRKAGAEQTAAIAKETSVENASTDLARLRRWPETAAQGVTPLGDIAVEDALLDTLLGVVARLDHDRPTTVAHHEARDGLEEPPPGLRLPVDAERGSFAAGEEHAPRFPRADERVRHVEPVDRAVARVDQVEHPSLACAERVGDQVRRCRLEI